jgi:hypothetical protein
MKPNVVVEKSDSEEEIILSAKKSNKKNGKASKIREKSPPVNSQLEKEEQRIFDMA